MTRRLVRALVTLSRQQWLTERTVAARGSAERALELARPLGDSYQNALATLNLGGLLVLIDREAGRAAVPGRRRSTSPNGAARPAWPRCAATTGAPRCCSWATCSGCDELLRSMAQAAELGNHEYVMRAYYNLIEGLWRLGEYREALGYIEQAESFGRDRDFRVSRLHVRRPPMPGWR